MLDINGDGLTDYLLYNTGTSITGAPRGSLVAYLNSPTGAFRGPVVINQGFDYPRSLANPKDPISPTNVPDLDAIDQAVCEAINMVSGLTRIFSPGELADTRCTDGGAFAAVLASGGGTMPPDQFCKSVPLPGTITCIPYTILITKIADRADLVLAHVQPFMSLTMDAIPRERELVKHVVPLKDTLRTFGQSIAFHPDLVSVDFTTAVARALVANLALVARTLRHINYSSRVNTISTGFSELDGSLVDQKAAGMTAQTKGFVDLNGDGLPDYVVTNDRESPCPTGTWQVFWGSGTSSLAQNRAFLRETDAAGQLAPTCMTVPAAPDDVVKRGFTTLPLNVDFVSRAPTAGNQIDTQVDSFVSLHDVNRDGRPDIIIAGDSWRESPASQLWHVFFNTGSGFETIFTNIGSPTTTRTDVEPASTLANPRWLGRNALNVPYPALRTSHAVSTAIGSKARATSETHATLLDIDGDGVPEMVRRVRVLATDTAPARDGLLVWHRSSVSGPQDLMIEERDPVGGSRRLIEYRSAASFQWPDAQPDGAAPPAGHSNIAGVAGQLVRSVTEERVIGHSEQRTRSGYDYKLPHFDMATRMPNGFALRTRYALDPLPDNPAAAQPIARSLAFFERNAQRPNGLPGLTHTRSVERGSGAPVDETITSFLETGPVTACPGIGSFSADAGGACPALGGLRSIFSAPNRVLRVEYPSSVATGPVLELSFDGRAPWRDAVSLRRPQMPAAPCAAFDAFLSSAPDASAATGGAARITSTQLPVGCATPAVVQYASPFLSGGTTPAAPLRAATLELWINPDAPAAEQVVAEQPGAMRLSIVNAGGGWHWRLDYGLAASITSTGPDDLLAGQWQHVVATYGTTGARIFVNGRVVAETAVADQSVPNGALVVGCGAGVNGVLPRCFDGALGELRAYAEYWPQAPRVSGTATEMSAPAGCRYDGGVPCPHDFGQPRLKRHYNDLADDTDDVVSELKYAEPDAQSSNPRAAPVRGLVKTEAVWVPKSDGTPREFLSFTAHEYDGRPHGHAMAGNETLRAQFDGFPRAQEPAVAGLRVQSKTAYDPDCPGRVASVTEPLDATTHTTWDKSCAFRLAVTNPVGHIARTQYYGVIDPNDPMPQVTGKREGPYGTWPLTGRYGQVARTIDANGAASLTTHDEWGRISASWAPLDRADRPPTQVEYADACPADDVNAVRCYPARTTTRTWDDQLRRCMTGAGKVVACSDAKAVAFVPEQATGAYSVSHLFADGQLHAQSVSDGKPAWTVSGIADFDSLGRMSRAYKIQFLPSACRGAGAWCNLADPPGDLLRSSVAALQFAYDARGRTIRTYGPAWPRCAGDPSAVTSTVPGARDPDCDQKLSGVKDYTRISYPAPGDTLTIDANEVPTLVRTDTRGLVTLTRDYVLAGRNAPPGTPPTPYSTVTLAYDALGRLVRKTDEAGNATLNTYDALSRLRSATDPDLGLTTFEYDLRSLLTDSLAATGEKTHHEYDAAGRLVQTDFLRPKQVPAGSSGPTFDPSVDDRPVTMDPPWCYNVPDFADPTRFKPIGGWPDPLPELRALALTIEGPGVPQAPLTLPFDVSITVAGMPGSDVRAARAPKPRVFRFARGTPMRVTASGQVLLGNDKTGATFDLLGGASLQLSESGLRYGIAGAEGARTLTVEWQGVLKEQPESPVLVRMSVGEGGAPVRYEYERVPSHVAAGGLQLRDGAAHYATTVLPARDGPGSFVPAGSTYAFGDLPDVRNFRVQCDRFPKGGFAIPFAAGDGLNQRLRLGFRVLGACPAEHPDACRGELRVGYRVAAEKNALVQPLTLVPYDTRPPDDTRELPNEIDVALPDDLRNRKFEMVIEPATGARDIATANFTHDFQFTWPGRTQTIYEPEERVHRVYDSSEPPFYIATQTNGAKFEMKPLLDVTFDVPGTVTDRSPSRATFDATACAPGANAGNFVDGVSGSALSISPHTQCTGTLSARPLQEFTAELWVAPRCGANCPARSVMSAGTLFSISLLSDGRARCAVGVGAVDTNDPLPIDAWTHLALTFDGARKLQCSVNGVAQGPGATGSIAPNATLTGVRLGEPLATGAAVDVDEMRIIASARSGAEILEDALRPLNVGPPRGNLLHVDFGHAPAPGATCPNNSVCSWQRDQSQARNDAALVDGKIVPGIQGMVFDTRAARPAVFTPNLPKPTGLIQVAHSPTLQLADAVTPELWLKTTATQAGAARLIGKWAGPTTPGWRLQMTASGRLRWEIVTRYTPPAGGVQLRRSVFITQETVNDSQWHHIAATYDGQRMRVFRDGLPMHRWCGSGPREGAQEDGPDIENCHVPPPEAPDCAPIEMRETDLPILTGQTRHPVVGDSECIRGSIDNTEPLLAANDAEGAAFDGFIDELRLSNYAKREFEVAASARLAAAYTRTLGRETGMRNRFIVLDGRQVGPAANDQPYDLAWQPAREQRAYDLEGVLASGIKHVFGQRSADDYFLGRIASDSAGRAGLAQFPHGEVVVADFDLDGTQSRVVGYGPRIGSLPVQSQVYVAEAASTITGRPAQMKYGNGVSSSWTYDDGQVPAAASGTSSAAFGPDSLRTASVKSGAGAPLSDRVYDWDAVGNLKHVSDSAGGAGGTGQYDAEYGYDDLRRVTSATLALPQKTPLDLAYGYDPLGNLTLIDGSNAQGDLRLLDGARQAYGRTVSQTCAGAPNPLPHALTSRTLLTALPANLTINALCYDGAGRLIRSVDSVRNSINSYTYYARGKVRAIVNRNGESALPLRRQRGARVEVRSRRRDAHRAEPVVSRALRSVVAGDSGFVRGHVCHLGATHRAARAGERRRWTSNYFGDGAQLVQHRSARWHGIHDECAGPGSGEFARVLPALWRLRRSRAAAAGRRRWQPPVHRQGARVHRVLRFRRAALRPADRTLRTSRRRGLR
jgi:YD repeat-containing protein